MVDIDPERLGDIQPDDPAAVIEAIRELAFAVAELQGRIAILETAVQTGAGTDED